MCKLLGVLGSTDSALGLLSRAAGDAHVTLADGTDLDGALAVERFLEWSKDGCIEFNEVVKISLNYEGATADELQGFAHLHTLCTTLQEVDMSSCGMHGRSCALVCQQWGALLCTKLNLGRKCGGHDTP